MKVGFVDISASFSGQNYLPLSVADLQAYAEVHLVNPGDYEFLTPLYKRDPVDQAVERLMGADLVGFSLYSWNKRISLEIARRLKFKDPEVIVVFGGPEVPDASEPFLRANPFIDIACHNEGEQVFVRLLERSRERDWIQVPSASFIDAAGVYHQTEWLPRMRSLTVMPSPYLNGVFDRLIRENPDEQWLGLWETNRGCPFSCTFCDWGSSTKSKVIQFDLETLFGELEWFARHRIEYVYVCDANFGIFPRDVEIARRAAEIRRRCGYPYALSVQNAKNAEERIFEAQRILAEAGLNKGVALAFQSRDPKVLRAIKRDNISSEDFRRLQRRFTQAGIETYSDMIIGLPEETYDSFADGVSGAIKDGQHNRIQLENLTMMPNAPMAEPEYVKRYGLKTVETKAVVPHGLIDELPDQIHEVHELVIATASMPAGDWLKTKVFCWMVSLLHFDKIFQIPLIVLHETTGVSYRELIEVFTEGSLEEFPVLSKIRAFFRDKARSTQAGDIEYCPSREWLNIYWPADEFIFIKLVREGKLDSFYEEANRLLLNFLESKAVAVSPQILREAVLLNRALIKLPFQEADFTVALSWNIWEFYQSVLRMEPIALRPKAVSHPIYRSRKTWSSWDEWYREVVWFGNKRGAYLYGR